MSPLTLFSLLTCAALTASTIPPSYPHPPQTCPQPPSLSCSLPSFPQSTNKCCTETLGGLILSTQFWSTYTGLETSHNQVLPSSSWTLHGLWPDFCNGSWTQYCDLTRQYDPHPEPNTTTGKADGVPVPAWKGVGAWGRRVERLLKWMRKYWIAQRMENRELWAHEFSKHATCFSTFGTGCFSERGLERYEDLVEYFEAAKGWFEGLSTYAWLEEERIVPSNKTGYALGRIQQVLGKRHGKTPFVGCSGPRWNETEKGKGSLDAGRTVLSEVWYYFHVWGRVQERRGVPVRADLNGGSTSSCAKAEGAVRYLERAKGSEGGADQKYFLTGVP
ncbi:ribonuclease T2-like protein [Schizothecium vesticola]|uniref:ribonuclease T2 n=1 Tax=Schizothecium vesticola TaxID=314040 RepID=A0AA40ER66_9PEZI|nr:ribonuclease T2-like protein [Schizothecium vesticola]